MENHRMIWVMFLCVLMIIVIGLYGSYHLKSSIRILPSSINLMHTMPISSSKLNHNINTTDAHNHSNASAVPEGLGTGTLNASTTLEPLRPNYPTRTHPLRHIAFLKTHKCASSSIQNMLIRYGYTHDLKFALPEDTKSFSLGWPAKFNSSLHLAKFNGSIERPDILCLHATFSEGLHDLMPDDTFFVTSIREPISKWISTYVYYNWHGRSRMTAVDLFKAGFKLNSSRPLDPKRARLFHIQLGDSMLYDLGLDTTNATETEIADYIKKIESKFHLVIVVDYYYECMIILRDMLGLTTYDVLTLVNNARKDDGVPPVGVNKEEILKLSNEFMKKLRGDVLLYNHFKLKMEKIIENNRPYLSVEVHKLKTLAQTWSDFCIKDTVGKNKITDSRFKPFGNDVYGYVLNPEARNNQTCRLLSMAARSLINMVRSKTTRDHRLY